MNRVCLVLLLLGLALCCVEADDEKKSFSPTEIPGKVMDMFKTMADATKKNGQEKVDQAMKALEKFKEISMAKGEDWWQNIASFFSEGGFQDSVKNFGMKAIEKGKAVFG